MYIKIQFANSILVLIVTVIISIIIIFPIFINIKINFDSSIKKIYYEIKIFFIKILYGYIEKDTEGIIIHLNKRKAILIFYKDLFTMKDKAKPLKDYHLINFSSEISVGIKNDVIKALELGYLYNYIMFYIKWLTFNKKPYFNLDTKVNIYEEKNLFIYKCNSTVLLNLLMIIISLIKIFVEKIYYAIRNRLQQN